MEHLGTVKEAAIEWVVQSILEILTEKMKAWIRGVDLDGDVEKLKSATLFVNTVVSAARGRKLQNEGLCRSLLDLKQLLYDAEDVMDELDYYRLQREIEGGNGDGSAAGTHPMGDRASSSTWYSAAPIFFAKKIVDLALPNHRKRKREDDTLLAPESKHDVSQRINKIANQLRTAGGDVHRVLQLEISPTNAMPYQSLGEPRNTRLTTSMQVEPKVYGRDAERNKVVELLINEKYSDLRVLPIVGGGGVGKTTLARYVCDDQRIRSHFDLQMWVCVSTVFDEVRLTREILEHVCKEDGQDYGKISCFNVLQDILLKNIRNKRFLLVLDDIWEDNDKIGWDNLLAPLKRNQVPGCMILATTRRKSVAKMISPMEGVEMKGLDEEDFWLLFKACTFGNENCTDHPTLHTIGQQIAKTLKGYPLAAQSVGALLKENLSSQHWQDVQETWKSRQKNYGDVLPILELSYDYLPSHLQHCFSYCSLFPEDHRFNEKTLVCAWISQNFVQSKDTSKRLEETGMQYLYRLVDLGFFQKVDSHYVMHDLMHELAEKVSSNDCATINGSKSETIQPSVRHLSIITTAYDKDEHCNFPSEKFENKLRTIGSLKKLRTLMFFGLSSVNLLRTRSFRSLCKEIESLRLLRIHVTGADIDSVHNFIKPYHLRCLEFMYVFASGNQEDIAFPQALTRFYHLQVLGFHDNWRNPTVPTRMNNLVNLRHLFANEKVHSTIPSIGNMTSLQELRVFRVQNACGFEIKQLQSMNKLVQLGISQLGNVKTKEEASQAKLIDKEHLEMLWLSWDDSGMSLEPTTEGTRDVHVLEGLRPNQNLKYLHITGYSGATSPTWLDSNVSVTSLKTLHLEKCKGWQILPSLEMLPLLRELTLISMWNLNQIILPLEGMRSLKELKLVHMNYLKELSFPSLEKMELIQMSSLESCISTNMAAQKEWPSSLRELMIQDCPLLESLRLESCTALEELYIYGCEQLAVLDGSQFLCSLRMLHIDTVGLKSLRLDSCTALEELYIYGCEQLAVLDGSQFPCSLRILHIETVGLKSLRLESCTALEKLYICGCEQLAVLDGSFLCSLRILHIDTVGLKSLRLESCTALEELEIEGCEQLAVLDCSFLCSLRILKIDTVGLKSLRLESCTALEELEILRCEHLAVLEGLQFLCSLRSLHIEMNAELSAAWDRGSQEQYEGSDHARLLPPSVKVLRIYNLREEILPCFLAQLPSLSTLVVSKSPNLTSLQLGSCTALEILEISDCESLNSLNSLQSLRNLTDLRVLRCPRVQIGGYELCHRLERVRLDDPSASLQRLEVSEDKVTRQLTNEQEEALQLLTSLRELVFRSCSNLVHLPAGLHTLPSLKRLKIYDCKGISRLPEKGLPPSLEQLDIFCCSEELNEHCRMLATSKLKVIIDYKSLN